ncbi:MAG: EAL domain-containing protein [Chitinispirillaceae bacterium]|nr:EAL domain-containing protein [Chitinispirillaceae bacterium]
MQVKQIVLSGIMEYSKSTKPQLIKEIQRLNDFIQSNRQKADILHKKLIAEADAIFLNSVEGIFITDSRKKIIRVNPGFCHITGYTEEEVLGKTPSIFKSNRHDKKFYGQIYESLENNGSWQGEIWNRRKNGEIYPQWLSIIALVDKNCADKEFLAIFNDITNLINKNENIQSNAQHDSLTGLPNRLLLHDRLEFTLNLARRNKRVVAVLLLDIMRFKMINDTLGYTAGDALLQILGSRLSSSIRDVDTVFRSGDDEFAIILDDVSEPEAVSKVAKRIIETCSLPFTIANRELYATVSIGISIFPSDAEGHEGLLKNAEDAMIRAKELGINNYQHYKPAMNNRAVEQLTLENDIRKALMKEEFIVYYQPQVDLKTNEIVGIEALIRWKHPKLGMISPGEFIPIAEENGLIIPIGEWVLRTACSQTEQWRKQYKKGLTISVNLSARQFLQQDIVNTVRTILDETGLAPKYLELEITESLGMKNPELTLRTLKELKQMGIHISIDDFGTGYSSLSYLKKFPIDTLKIDRSFVSDIKTDLNDTAIVLAIIALAHSMHLKVIAEGVETIEQAEFLSLHDCEEMQGYLFSPPIPAMEFAKLLEKQIQTQ